MQLTSFRGVTFTTLGVTTPKFAAPESPSASRQAQVIDRVGADPIVTGVEVGARAMTFSFTPNGSSNHNEPTFAKILALLNPDDPIPATLVGSFLKTGPSTFVTVEATAICGGYRYSSVNTLLVDFVIQGPWREQASTTLKTAGLVTVDGSFTNLNTGFRDVLPVVTVYWDGTQRSSSTATFGWKHRIGAGQTITNIGTEPLINQPYQLGPIDTAALVTATQMQADGDDLRVFCEGVELRRNLIAPNTKFTFIWVVLPTIAPADSCTLDILTNNSSATSPPTMNYTSDPPLPAMDISGTNFLPTSATASTVTLTGAGWEDGQWTNATLIVSNAAGTGAHGHMRRVNSNTATVLTVNWDFTSTPLTSDTIILVRSGLMGAGRVATSGAAGSLTDTTASYEREFVGSQIQILAGTGSGQTRTISSIAGNQINVTPNWTTNPASGSVYRIYKYNTNRLWDVRGVAGDKASTLHKGLWFANKSQAPPSRVHWDAAGSWYRFTYARSRDAYSQPRFTTVSVGAGDNDHFTNPYIQRARRGKNGSQTEVGIADAIGVSCPFPIRQVRMGVAFRNAKKAGSGTPGEGMCEAKWMCQESGGEQWSTFYSDKAVYNATTEGLGVPAAQGDLTLFGSPNRVAIALVPNASDEIPDQDNNTALLKTTTEDVWQLYVDPASAITESIAWIETPPAVVAVYDVDLIVRNGGASATKPYERIRIGGIDHRIFIAATDERIVVDCEKHLVTLTTDAGVFIRRIPYVLQSQELVTDPDGVAQTLVTSRWVPIASSAIDAANIYYSDPSGAGWGSVGLLVTGKLGYLT